MNKALIYITLLGPLFLITGCASLAPKPKTCEDHKKLAVSAHEFGVHNFNKGYANASSVDAQAQLFLIKEKFPGRPGSYATSYNNAEYSYNKSLKAAQSMGCDTSDYPISPIRVFEEGTQRLIDKEAGKKSE